MQESSRSCSTCALWNAIVAATGGVAATATGADCPAKLDVEVGKPGATLPASFFGLMTEEINHSYDGGLYAELIQNRTFQDPRPGSRGGSSGGGDPLPLHWSVIGPGKVSTDETDPVNAALPTSLRLDLAGGETGIANDGYWGIPVWPNTAYTARFYARGSSGFAGSVTASLRTDERNVTVTRADPCPITGKWQKYTVTLRTGRDAPTTARAFRPVGNRHRRRVVQLGLAVPTDVPELAEWFTTRPDGAPGRPPAEVYPSAWRQLPRGQPVLRSVQLEANDRPG
jgi:alpha-N-arabinofuranosidase